MAPSTPDVHAEPQWLVHALRTEISGADVRSKLEHEWRTQPAHARIAIAELMREYIPAARCVVRAHSRGTCHL